MKDGEIAGAFSVSMPKYRLTEENKTTINQALWQQKRLKRKKKDKQKSIGILFVFSFFIFVKTFAFFFYLYNEVVNFFIINIYF